VLHQQAVTAINSLNQEKKLSVLAAIGKTKTGKSYLLNKLISKFLKE
jgi:ribosome biogenesis GTPase A